MFNIITMASMLTLEPPSPTPTPMQIDHVTVEQSSDAAHVLAYDSDGQVAGVDEFEDMKCLG